MTNRRNFFKAAGAVALGATAVSRVGAASLPEAVIQTSPTMQPPLVPTTGRPYNPVATLNGWSLPWRTNNGIKEFHLVAEPVVREFAPGMKANLWGYNGSSPGPTIEAVEGDRVRIFVTNRLPEHTTVHWHGILLPSGMDGVGGLTQPHIPPGKTFVYEFTLLRSGTHMYHPHADEMTQMAMGMMGMFVIHPKDARQLRVDRDFVFLLASYDIEPGSATPRTAEMTDFNLWTWNSRVFPGIDPLVARTGERVRIRIGNLTMTNHPIHMHGPHFVVTGTDGGWVPPAARWPLSGHLDPRSDSIGGVDCVYFPFLPSRPWQWCPPRPRLFIRHSAREAHSRHQGNTASTVARRDSPFRQLRQGPWTRSPWHWPMRSPR